jgi:hypothetical protein
MKLLTFRRLKMKPVAESKNSLPQASKNTDEHKRTSKDQRFDRLYLGLGDRGRVYIGGDL